jgi:hypothetical protein
MLTLCRLASPVSIRPPRAPQLKEFKFFTSCARQADGSERLYLHMGYFATLADAQKWAQLVRGAYPGAIATPVPAAVLQQPNSGIPTLPAAEAPRAPAAVSAQRETQHERPRANESRLEAKSASDPFQDRIDRALASDQPEPTSAGARHAAAHAPRTAASTPASGRVASSTPAGNQLAAAARGRTESFEQTHELLPSSEIWTQ